MSNPEEHLVKPELDGELLPDDELDAVAGGDIGSQSYPPYL